MSMKKRARESGSGKFVAGSCAENDGPAKQGRGPLKVMLEEEMVAPPEPGSPKRPVGRPKVPKRKPSKSKKEAEYLTFEVSITVSVAGADIDRGLLSRAQEFLVERTLAGKCSLERGGTAYHLHLQMVARLQAKSLVAISRSLKTNLGWDANQLAGGMVMCRKLTYKGLHTFHGLLGYCMKDASRDHFETIDHNISAEDINLGLEQYALYGKEENKNRVVLTMQNKNRVVLTMQNLVERVFMWRKFNCKHPLIVDFGRDLYEMLKTGKYYPAASWVVGGCGKGYDPSRMQSLYKIMVTPHEISREDVENVFETPDTHAYVPRKQWFGERWKDQPCSDVGASKPVKRVLFSEVEVSEEETASRRAKFSQHEMASVLVHTPKKPDSSLDVLCVAAAETSSKRQHAVNKKGKNKINHLWPEEWNIETQSSSAHSSEENSEREYKSVLTPSTFIPLYSRMEPDLVVS